MRKDEESLISISSLLHHGSIALKMWLSSCLLIYALLTMGSWPARPQEQTPANEPTNEFFSGSVAQIPDGRVVVVRTLMGKPPETRTFLIKAETKVEGKLRVKARVTVGFRTTDDGDVAVRIIVRTAQQTPKK